MESVFVIGIGCVAWTVIEVFRLTSGSATIAMPANGQTLGHSQSKTGTATASSQSRPGQSSRSPRFAAWDDRGRPVTVEDLGHA